ncbi:unnamed protein product [marine sediment metagenome]|uniref:Uncharacterized protein n=1 Tax=marine sediment metagenome TaxID=412755 RepID=X0TS56_9ZZZZ
MKGLGAERRKPMNAFGYGFVGLMALSGWLPCIWPCHPQRIAHGLLQKRSQKQELISGVI